VQTSALQLDPKVVAVFEEGAAVLKPPPKLTVSQWAEQNRVLSSETSSYRGLYRCSLAPYQRGMMDAVHIPGVEEIVYWTGAQLGKSTVEENIFGYFATQDPCPTIWMWPTQEVAKAWSNDTLEPLLRDTPSLSRLFASGARKSSNRTLVKRFPGGILSVIGANSPAEMRRRRARLLICDEIDANPVSVGDEGDSIAIIEERMVTFWNAIKVKASTCTIKDESAVEAAYAVTNRQKYHVPCLHCGELQLIDWDDVRAPRGEEPTVENTTWTCPRCSGPHYEADKLKILTLGEWVAERPEVVKRQGFWLPSYYSPFEPWHKQVAQWREINAHRETTEKLKVFTNLKLAKTWEVRAIKFDVDTLLQRRELEWPSPRYQAPAGVCVITAGCDVQPDRIEVEVVGHGRHFESWSLETKILDKHGPVTKPEVWKALDEFLQTRYAHEKGVVLPIATTFIDCGYNQGEVMNFTKKFGPGTLAGWRRIWASKGMSTFTAVPLGKRNQNNKQRVWMYPVGVSSIKKTIYERLSIETPGPGCMHFGEHNDAEYFEQLTCEKLQPKNVNGRVAYEWVKPPGTRNEALDRRVYATAALLSLWDIPEKGIDREYARILDEAKRLREQGKLNSDQMSLLDPEQPPAAAAEEKSDAEDVKVAETAERLDQVLQQAPEVPKPEPPKETPPPPAPKRRRVVVTRHW
jgi:phage terminase large subunit GpA-like protein